MATATLTRFQVTASFWHYDQAQRDSQGNMTGKIPVEQVAGSYDKPAAAEALAAFAAEHPEIVAFGSRCELDCRTPGTGDPPGRHLLNWEKDPDAEVSDGWLSNIAAAGNSIADRLEWEPEYCTKAHRLIPCPSCGAGLRERTSKYGGFYSCPGCGWKTGWSTKKAKAAEALATITGWCGTAFTVGYNHLGVPYRNCLACAPDYKCPTVSGVYR